MCAPHNDYYITVFAVLTDLTAHFTANKLSWKKKQRENVDKKQICKKYLFSLLVYYKNIYGILVYTET